MRGIRLVATPGEPRTFAPGMTNRPLIAPGRWEEFDPFLLLMEDWMQEPGGFPDHPHRGIETVTLVLEGELAHADNRGNQGVLSADDLQWMTAGSGIVHSELPSDRSASHTLQLWLNLSAAEKMVESNYQDLLARNAQRVDDGRTDIRVVSGSLEGVAAPTANHTPVLYLDMRVAADSRTIVPIPASHNGFIHVVEGEARFGVDAVVGRADQVLWLDYPTATSGGSSLEIRTEAPVRLLIVTGKPIREPVVAYGPFVMNTQEQIVEAYRDFHAGRFGGPTPAALALMGR